MAMYSLGNALIAQAQILTADGDQKAAEMKFQEAMEYHFKVVRLWTITLGGKHHKTADAMHKAGWHLHRRQEYGKAK